MGAVEDLIVWEDLDMLRLELHNKETGEQSVVYRKPESGAAKKKKNMDEEEEVVVVKEESLVDWICDNYKTFGCRLALVSDRTAAGRQFAQGLGGIGGLLRWKVDFQDFQEEAEKEDIWSAGCNLKGDSAYGFNDDDDDDDNEADGDFGF